PGYDENHFFSKNLVDGGFIMRGWPHVVSERLIFNDSSVFLRKCAVLPAAPSKQGVGEAASSVRFPVQEKPGGHAGICPARLFLLLGTGTDDSSL
ncbi:hypothetical protein, partial [Akkermansia sp.]